MTPEQIEQRDESFEKYCRDNGIIRTSSDGSAIVIELGKQANAWSAWSAATKAQRERDAKIALDEYLIPLEFWHSKKGLTAELGRRIAAIREQP